jgi:hypothetical protein
MTLEDEELLLENTPVAHSVTIVRCVSPECGYPHLVFFNEEGIPLLQFVVDKPRPDGSGFFSALKAAVERRDS